MKHIEVCHFHYEDYLYTHSVVYTVHIHYPKHVHKSTDNTKVHNERVFGYITNHYALMYLHLSLYLLNFLKIQNTG